MKIGVCGYVNGKNADGSEFDLLAAAKRTGFDYIELPLSTVAALSEADFAALRERIEASGLPCECCNVCFPGTLRLTGPEVDHEKTRTYLRMAYSRASALGVRAVVFGSAGARNVPAGFPLEQAYVQLTEMLRIAGDIAAENGITIVIEPLNRGESNILQSASEGMTLAKMVDHPNVRLLVDYFHMAKDGEDCGIILTAREWIRHAHFADPDGRAYPAVKKETFREFFGALKRSGYAGRLSLEAGFKDFERDAQVALAIMRELAAE